MSRIERRDPVQEAERELNEQKQEQMAAKYAYATRLLKGGKLEEAARRYQSLGQYKDAQYRAQRIFEKLGEVPQQMEDATGAEISKEEMIYTAAVRRVAGRKLSALAIKKSMEELATIRGYKDAEQQLKILNIRLGQWVEAKKLADAKAKEQAERLRRAREEKARQNALRAKKVKRVIATVAVTCAVLAILLVVSGAATVTVGLPYYNYCQANELLESGEYAQARAAYEKIVDGFGVKFKSEQCLSVLDGISLIQLGYYDNGIQTILEAEVPVELQIADGGNVSAQAHSISARSPLALSEVDAINDVFSYESSEEFVGLPLSSKVGYEFLGYEVEEISYQVGETFRLTLRAKWEACQYYIEIDTNGGLVLGGINPGGYNIEDETFTLINPERNGYTFIGWTGTDLTEPAMEVTINSGSIGNRSYMANWKANTYTITLDANEGTVDMETVKVIYDSEYALPIPERLGHTFVGWYYDGICYSNGTWTIGEDVTLSAVWDAVVYSIDVDLNGGYFNSDTKDNYTIYDRVNLGTPYQSGYTFIGWTGTDLTEPTMNVTIEPGSVGDRSYQANWRANTYTITFDPNGGSVENTTLDVTYDSAYTLPVPTKTGYTFAGWYQNGCRYEDGIWNYTQGVTLTASWVANSYNVTFENLKKNVILVTFDENYDWAPTTTFWLNDGDLLYYPDVPTRDGYVFTGWYTDADCTQRYSFSGTITENMTLYAGWGSEVYTVSNDSYYPWSLVDGVLTSTMKSHSNSSSYTITAATDVTVSFRYKVSSEANYDYLRIYVNGSRVISVSGTTSYVNYTVNLSAGDTLRFTYSKDGSASSGSDCAYIADLTVALPEVTSTAVAETRSYEVGSSVTAEATFGETFNLPVFARTGYTFLGWYNGEEPVTGTPWNVASNVTLTPRWQANSYTITFDPNGGSMENTTLDVTYDSAYTLPTPTRTGYTFNGWYLDDTQYVDGIWSGLESITLTAGWSANTYSVTFDGMKEDNVSITVTFNPNYDGGTDIVTTLTHDQLLAYPTVPTRDGYVFTGWYSDASCTQVYSFTGTITGNMTLYAGWTRSGGTVVDTVESTAKADLSAIRWIYDSETTRVEQITYDQNVQMPILNREGYTFLGWYNGDELVESGAWSIADDVTLVARWSENGES